MASNSDPRSLRPSTGSSDSADEGSDQPSSKISTVESVRLDEPNVRTAQKLGSLSCRLRWRLLSFPTSPLLLSLEEETLAQRTLTPSPLDLLILFPSQAIRAADGRRPPREATPPPVIGKAGSLTVFITPPPTPRSNGASPRPSPAVKTAPPPPPPPPPPPVQVPPPQFEKAATSSGSVFGFFWEAVAKVQDMHSSLDEYLADWFGLDQSKYQWALNDYYENNGKEKEVSKGNKPRELNSKGQVV
uniref:Uncharacterized protein n=1 Tax=Ananas comosus var. bracteatus TaxID=296719 RepID=A0A6V7P1U7_ANACO|nr:unnamed protein product [Ananas comosus var. bracteatus]